MSLQRNIACLVLPATSLLLLLAAASGCMVSRETYDEARQQVSSCQEEAGRLQSASRSLEREMSALRKRNEDTEKENRSLLEDLAVLGAEQEELTRKIAMYKKQMEEREKEDERVQDTFSSLIDRLSTEINEGNIRIDQSDTRLKLNLVDKILFPSGSATLTRKGKQVLEKVGYALKETKDRRIIIEGHTDDLPVNAGGQSRFQSNWDLSALRATAVVQYLQDKMGIDPRLLSATGYSMYSPIEPNDSAEHRGMNRRIEIVLVPLTPQEMQRLYVLQPPPQPAPPKAAAPPPRREEPPVIIPIVP